MATGARESKRGKLIRSTEDKVEFLNGTLVLMHIDGSHQHRGRQRTVETEAESESEREQARERGILKILLCLHASDCLHACQPAFSLI